MKRPGKKSPKSKLALTKSQKRIVTIGALTIPITMSVGHVLGNIVRNNVPIKPVSAPHIRTTEHPSLRSPKKPKTKKQKIAKPDIPPELHERWAGMVLGEVGPDAPKTVWRKVARTVPTRASMPGWKNKTHMEILDPGQYYAVSSSTLETRKKRHPIVFNEIRDIVKEEHRKPVTSTDATHFYTTRLLVDGEGKLILDKQGNPIETRDKPPAWATHVSFVGEEVWQPSGEPVDKGPVKIKFYRHRS